MSNRYRHPTSGPSGALFTVLANHPGPPNLRRTLLSRLPLPILESDLVEVVYLTWWVDAAAAAAWNPCGVPLWTREGGTPFTVLAYAHGHLAPPRRAFAAMSCRPTFPHASSTGMTARPGARR